MKKIAFFLLFVGLNASAECRVSLSNGAFAPPLNDALNAALQSSASCPRDVRELKSLLSSRGLRTAPSMVANRGFHNPALGSFSFFETVTGPGVGDAEFFFGHFTQADHGTLSLAQTPSSGALMIELIVWDVRKGLYNFYELIGAEPAPRWFYRGDSADILADNQFVNRDGSPKFGNRLRCSGCHSSGGPIMKEITFPHNDWWLSSRPLPLGANRPDAEVNSIMTQLRGADAFSKSVVFGLRKLEASRTYQQLKSARSLQEELRPLFCENEINLASDVSPMDGGPSVVTVPTEFVAHPFLATGHFTIAKGAYLSQVAGHGMRFPETSRADGDHAFLTPVRSVADELAVQTLLAKHLVDEEFVGDVLSVDAERPLFSAARCSLLKALPLRAMPDWKAQFEARLQALASPAARALLQNLRDPERTLAFHRRQATIMAQRKIANVEALFNQLLDVRAATAQSEISQNPRGRILEPGFRVIFPIPTRGR